MLIKSSRNYLKQEIINALNQTNVVKILFWHKFSTDHNVLKGKEITTTRLLLKRLVTN